MSVDARMARSSKTRPRWLAFLAAGLVAVAASPHSPRALPVVTAPRCTLDAIQAAAPPGMTIGAIDDLNTDLPIVPSGVRPIPAQGPFPAYCLVTGTIVTDSRSGKTTNFGSALPMSWNQRFVQTGCGHYCGQVFQALPTDENLGLAQGNAVIATDDGHGSTPPGASVDASWALKSPGVPDEDAVIDFFYRAVHTVAVVGRQFAQNWYAESTAYSYFMGCSDGGREGMVEATRYPDDFDGYVVGDPFFDIPGQTLAGRSARALLNSPDSYIPPSLLAIVDHAISASCDATDGVQDGLIQDPGRCNFLPERLLCNGTNAGQCLTPHQVETLLAWFSAARDPLGRVRGYGYPVSDLFDDSATGPNLFAWTEAKGAPLDITAAEPWGPLLRDQPDGWSGSDQAYKYLVFLDPSFDSNHHSPVDRFGIVDPLAMALIDARLDAGRGDDPLKLSRFLRLNRKVVMYHGFSDGFINPFRTMTFFEAWAQLVGGYDALGQNARLFMVPGMYHCGSGPGPNVFDVRTAIESWVESGIAPEQIIARKYPNDDRAMPVQRSMPLCRFPTQATYSGHGDVNDAANWSCPVNDVLLHPGLNGLMAGLPR